MRDIVKALKALSDETRIRILRILLERECCVCEVVQALDISQPRASRNLSMLEDAGFVRSRRHGLWTLYSVDEHTKNICAAFLTEVVGRCLVSEETISRDVERLSRAVRCRPTAVGRQASQ